MRNGFIIGTVGLAAVRVWNVRSLRAQGPSDQKAPAFEVASIIALGYA
jgi:hypothetical protein